MAITCGSLMLFVGVVVLAVSSLGMDGTGLLLAFAKSKALTLGVNEIMSVILAWIKPRLHGFRGSGSALFREGDDWFVRRFQMIVRNSKKDPIQVVLSSLVTKTSTMFRSGHRVSQFEHIACSRRGEDAPGDLKSGPLNM